MTFVRLSSRWGVHAETTARIDAPADETWTVMQRFNRFIAADPYHTRVTDTQGNRLNALPPRGTRLRIGHGIGFTWFDRVGTLIRHKPGQCFAFTDLSPRGPNAGFPHVYKYTLTPISEQSCEIKLTVRGKWSARWLPRPIVYAWLWWVMAQADWSLRTHTAYDIRRLQTFNNAGRVARNRKVVSE